APEEARVIVVIIVVVVVIIVIVVIIVVVVIIVIVVGQGETDEKAHILAGFLGAQKRHIERKREHDEQNRHRDPTQQAAQARQENRVSKRRRHRSVHPEHPPALSRPGLLKTCNPPTTAEPPIYSRNSRRRKKETDEEITTGHRPF
ncbi:MAG: hypothetical protein MI824_01665, partial [Hyphomicrobiales bacterium]|nr:hypothetical protein [Hyphomicrobiales bacterium]